MQGTSCSADTSGFAGAVVMTLVAYMLAQRPSTMPVYAMFLPGFWLLVPGSLGLIGLTTFVATPESASSGDLLAIVGSIAAVALDVLCGVEFHGWLVGANDEPAAFVGVTVAPRLTLSCGPMRTSRFVVSSHPTDADGSAMLWRRKRNQNWEAT